MAGRRRGNIRAVQQLTEERYARYTTELRDLLSDADGKTRGGQWGEAANDLTAAMSTLAAMIGTARELHLIYQFTED